MRGYNLIEEEVQIVLVGSFNATIFHPQWFALKELMTEAEANEAKIEVCHQEVTKFTTDWHQIEVFPTRFVARTKHMGRIEELRDFVASTFKVLSETPIDSMGINRSTIYGCPSQKAWHAVGDTLAPKGVWRGVFKSKDLGMKSVEMRAARTDGIPGLYHTTVFPVMAGPEGPRTNVGFKHNSHFEVKTAVAEGKAESLFDLLMEHTEKEVEFASSVSKHIMDGIDADANFGRE